MMIMMMIVIIMIMMMIDDDHDYDGEDDFSFFFSIQIKHMYAIKQKLISKHPEKYLVQKGLSFQIYCRHLHIICI